MTAADVDLQNLSDGAHVGSFEDAKQNVRNIGTWNPMTLTIKQFGTATAPVHDVFNSSEIPGEIQDLLVVNTKTLKAHPAFGNALTATWYQATAKMEANDQAALSIMAATSPTSLDNYKAMLSTTAMYYKAADAAAFAQARAARASPPTTHSCSSSSPTAASWTSRRWASRSRMALFWATPRTSSSASTRPTWTPPPPDTQLRAGALRLKGFVFRSPQPAPLLKEMTDVRFL